MIIEVRKGEHIAGVAERLVRAARELGSVTEATFNDVRLVATPDSSVDSLCRYYAEFCRGAAAVSEPGRTADSRDFDAARIRRLESTADRLRIELAELRESARAEIDALRAEVGRLTRERDDALTALGRQTYTAPYRELVAWNNGDGPDPRDKTDAEWIAIGRLRLHAAGLDAAPADEGGAP